MDIRRVVYLLQSPRYSYIELYVLIQSLTKSYQKFLNKQNLSVRYQLITDQGKSPKHASTL